MKEIKPYHFLIFVGILIIGLGILFSIYLRDNRLFDRLNSEYPLIKNDDFISGKVTYIHLPEEFRNNPHSARFVLNDGAKWTLVSYYDISDNFSVDDAVKIGSEIFKQAGNDTIKITNPINNGSHYYFIISEF